MDLGLPDKAMNAKFKEDFPMVFKRKFDEFSLNGTLKTDKDELIRFQNLLRERNRIKDTVGGIKLYFGKQMNYEVFIRALDILAIEGTPTYGMFDENEMLVINAKPSELKLDRERRERDAKARGEVIHYNEPPCGNPEYEARQRALERENRQRMEMKNFRESYFNNHRYLFLAYFGIVLLNIYMLIKFNKNRIYTQKSYI